MTLLEQLSQAKSEAERCLLGGGREAHQHGEDFWWLAGWADNAIEAQMINEKVYREFLESKAAIAAESGIDCGPLEINPLLKPHQRDIVEWGVRGGRRGFFLSFGLGKTMIQLETLRLILEKSGGNGLIVCPLGVRQEFIRDSGMLGIPITFIRTHSEVVEDTKIYITNYESVRDGRLNPRGFRAVSLDEATILSSFGGTKTFRELMRMFEGTSTYRFVATATPSPNEFIELAAYADFLGIMDTGQIKTRFFKRDPTRADHLTLHPHKIKEFWMWCSTWGMFLQRPSDLGYSDEGYDLPPLDVRWHELPSDHSGAGEERDGQKRLIQNTAISVQNAAAEKRKSLSGRIKKLMDLRSEDPDAHRVIWHDLEKERESIEKAIPEIATVYGRQDLEEREDIVIEFSEGRLKEIACKPVMLGSGTNLQRYCSWEIFLGIGFKFRDFIQSIHRCHRFLAPHRVRVDLIYTENERQVREILQRKWDQHQKLVDEMSKIIREYGLAREALANVMRRSIGVDRREACGENWTLVNNDSILETASMVTGSVGLILTSIPFSTQYEYSPSYNDLGHNESTDRFWKQMDFITPELIRVLQPGRICAIHVKDRITPGGITGLGFQTVQPFHAEAIDHYTKHGFAYIGMKTITTDVVRENNQTYRLGWTEQCKDGSKMGVGMPEYLLLFRKPPTDNTDGYADVPVVKEKPLSSDNGNPTQFDSKTNWKHPVPGTGYSRGRWQLDAHGYSRSSGDRLFTGEELRQLPHEKMYKLWRNASISRIYDYEEHVDVCERLDEIGRLPATFMLFPPHSLHPDVWTDITRMRTLNGAQSAQGRESHLCPIQFDIAERVIRQMSMEGETVYDPFAGLGTVPMIAVQMKRKGIGCELSPSYFDDSVWYLGQAELKLKTPTLFDLLEVEEG